MLKLVIGVPASGKTHWINSCKEFADAVKLDIYNYQQMVREEFTDEEYISSHDTYRILFEANERIIKDIVEHINAGEDVIVEHTLYKMKRRLQMIDVVHKVSDTPIEIYLMQPSDEQLQKNCELKDTEDEYMFWRAKRQMEDVELPSVSEGFAKTFYVIDGQIEEYKLEVSDELLAAARREIENEQEKMRAEIEQKITFEKAVEETKIKPFWHICEGCGKREFITSKVAFEDGWDYPGAEGLYKDRKYFGFKTIAPRTCGECSITSSMFWKMMSGENLTDEDKKGLERIQNEPMCLLLEQEETPIEDQ